MLDCLPRSATTLSERLTNYLRHGGTVEKDAYIAGHSSTRTTQLYNRTDDEISLDEIERIRI